ncbi:hypothetical protein CPB86DRAFT_785515 [Serendipita vermifera]|nr:hypothetical protein CPB86DRAFT_785515 [Serendipita vermifera]
MLLQFRDHKAAMMEAIRCLKPGGLVLFLDTGGIVTEDHGTMYKAATSANPEWSWLQRMFKMVMCGSKKWNTDDTKAKRDVGEGFWDLEGCDPNKCGGLEAFVPLGDWASC